MQITWHGLSCIRIQTKDATILVDPFPATGGLAVPRLQADVFVFSDSTNPQWKNVPAGAFVLDCAGEFEHSNVTIHGTPIEQPGKGSASSLALFSFSAEGMLIGHLAGLARPLEDSELEYLEDADVLFIPVGGHGVLNADQATDVITQIEPRIVVPMYYRIPGLKQELDGVEKFTKELGAKSTENGEKLRISRKDLPDEDLRVVILKP